MTYTVDGARQLSMRQRNCVFFDEVKLRVSPHYYTFSACVRQCRMDKVVKACGCLPFFYTLLRESLPRHRGQKRAWPPKHRARETVNKRSI